MTNYNSVNEDVSKWIDAMTVREKIYQMAQIDISLLFKNDQIDHDKIEYYFGTLGVGSLLVVPFQKYREASEYRSIIAAIRNVTIAYGRPPVLVGIDSVHGANYIKNAVFLPQQLNIAATWNKEYSKYAGMIAARDTRAAGIPWIFSPIVGLGIQPLWPRMFETFGEDPYVVSTMSAAMIEGIQSLDENEDAVPRKSAACAKHFVGYSSPRTGHDRSPSWLPVRHLYQYFVPPWRRAIRDSNVMTVMESYTEYDGVPNVANRDSLRHLLREQLGFNGVLVTDYHEIENLVEFHHTAENNDEAISLSLSNGSVDISMIPFNLDGWVEGASNFVKMDTSYVDRIDESVRRIMNLKKELGLFEETFKLTDMNLQKIGSEDDHIIAARMARESIVLAKNHDDVLPLPLSEGLKVHITGPTSDSIRYQTGGWSINWQGAFADDEFEYGSTVKSASLDFSIWNVSHSCGVDILGNSCDEDESSIAARNEADYIIICVGEENYTEKPGDIRDLQLRQGQIDFVGRMKDSTDAKIIVIYFGGRPRLLKDIVQDADAILLAFLPGPTGGKEIMDLITGAHAPSGRLPITYPKFTDGGGVPYWSSISDQCTGFTEDQTLPNYSYTPCDTEYPFGHGLTYTSFHYQDLTVDSKEFLYHFDLQKQNEINVSVKVKNTGNNAAYETIMFFLFDLNRHVTPEYKRLFYFERVWLEPGTEVVVAVKITEDHMKYIGAHDNQHLIIQPGMRTRVGVGTVDCRRDSQNDLCSDPIIVRTSDGKYDPACESACILWKQSGCLHEMNISMKDCWDSCMSSTSLVFGEHGWGFNYVNCIERIVLDERQKDKCIPMTTLCRNVFHSQSFLTRKPFNVNPQIIVPIIAGIIGVLFMVNPFYKQRKQYNRANGIEFTRLSIN